MRAKQVRVWVWGLVLLGACGKGDKVSEFQPADPVQLVQGDLAAFDSESTPNLPSDFRRAYVAVFGGTRGSDVRAYVEAGAKHFFSDRDDVSMSPNQPAVDRWKKGRDPARKSTDKGQEKVIVGAANMGSALWFQGLMDGVAYTFSFRGTTLTVDTPGVGLIYLGNFYSDYFQHKGDWYPVSQAVRKMILAHEARHGHCTEETQKKVLEMARESSSSQEFEKKFPLGSCLHTHRACPKGPLKGEFACDTEAWGSYAISWLYSEARSRTYDRDWSTMNATALDQKSRLMYDTKDLLSGKFGMPDGQPATSDENHEHPSET